MNRDRIATLLSQGIRQAQVASIVGISPSRLSQLLKEDEELKNLIALKEADISKENAETVALQGKVLTVKHALLDQMAALIPVSELRDITSAYRAIHEAEMAQKKGTLPTAPASPIQNNTLIVNMPVHALPRPSITVNEQNEVISVNEKTLAPLSAEGVTALFKTLALPKELSHV